MIVFWLTSLLYKPKHSNILSIITNNCDALSSATIIHIHVTSCMYKNRHFHESCMYTLTHPTQQILTTEVNLVERVCLPRVEPAFIDATICTLSSPTHSKLLS